MVARGGIEQIIDPMPMLIGGMVKLLYAVQPIGICNLLIILGELLRQPFIQERIYIPEVVIEGVAADIACGDYVRNRDVIKAFAIQQLPENIQQNILCVACHVTVLQCIFFRQKYTTLLYSLCTFD
jgi:hypothetical protein